MAVVGVGLLVRSRLRRFGRLRSRTVTVEQVRGEPDVKPGIALRLAFAAVLLFSLTIPSNWTQDVPDHYGSRHPGLHHTWMYPDIDTSPPANVAPR